MLFMGIDVGTQGVRAVVSDHAGNIVAGKSVAFEKLNESVIAGHYEQRPLVWWKAAVESLRACVAELKKNGYKPSEIYSVAVDGTSGTMLPVDKNGNAMSNALMYNDQRATAETDKVRLVAGEHEQKMGLRFNRSFALPRVLWFKDNRPDIYEKAWKIIHQTDYMVGRLCGEFGRVGLFRFAENRL